MKLREAVYMQGILRRMLGVVEGSRNRMASSDNVLMYISPVNGEPDSQTIQQIRSKVF